MYKKIRIGYVLKSADVLGLKSPVGILKIHPTHTHAHSHIPTHNRAHPHTPEHTRTYPHTPMHTPTHTYSWPELKKPHEITCR